MSTAETWDSYKQTLLLVLNNILPRRCLEWGSGKSTKTISDHPSVNTLESVEHNPEWIDRLKGTINDKVNLIYEPDQCLYFLVQGRYDKYDLIFIDGVSRETCIVKAKDMLEDDGVVILHDAERTQYQNSILSYTYRFWRDFGHTIVLTNSKNSADTLDNLFRGVANV